MKWLSRSNSLGSTKSTRELPAVPDPEYQEIDVLNASGEIIGKTKAEINAPWPYDIVPPTVD